MGRLLLTLLALCTALGALPAAAQDAPKIALLIGNQKYDASVGELRNPHNDIALVGEALGRQGFQLLPAVKDGRRSAILGAVREFTRRLNAAGAGAVGFLYYSGHGAAESDANINYLIPVDARDPGTTSFWDDSVKLDDVIKLLDGARSAAKFVVFDACRNELRMPTKSSTKGFVPVAEQQGMFIAYASATGRTASDAGAGSGPYAAALAAELAKPGLDHLGLFQNIKEAVFAKTGGVQQPWESNGLFRRVYLTGRPKTQPAPPSAQSQVSEASQTWAMVKDSANASVLEAFIRQFGDTVYGAMARARLEEVKKQQLAVAPPPPVAKPTEAVKPAAIATPERERKPAVTTPATRIQLSIATGGTGGVYYPLGGAFANLVSKELAGVTATAEVTGGSVSNLQLIASGKADICFSQVDAAWDAINGRDKFASGKLPIRAVAVMYPNHTHVVTVEGTGIAKIEDMKARRVSTGSPGSATEGFAIRVLEAAGLNHETDIRKERLGVAESVNALRDKKIDGFFWVGGLPTAAITDLAATPNFKIKIVDIAHLTAKINAKYGPLYTEATIPAATYRGMDVDAKDIAAWNIAAVNANMDEKLAYDLTRIMIEKRQDLALGHKEALNIKPEWQTSNRAGIPWHPGALRYFKEKGIKVE